MSTTEQRRAANRANARLSTGPATVEGKAVACRNATRHGLLSSRLLLDDEDPEEFQILLGELAGSLNPFGAVEEALVERIAVSLWRQRRIVAAETARLALMRQPKKLADSVSSELGRRYDDALVEDELAPFDEEMVQWCRDVIAEIQTLEEIDLDKLESQAPLIHEHLCSAAEEDDTEPARFVKNHPGGLTGYVDEVLVWCSDELRKAEARPRVQALAAQVRAKHLVLPRDTLEVMARYQSMLDNQLYKALKALREAQEWRLKTLDAAPIARMPHEAALAELA